MLMKRESPGAAQAAVGNKHPSTEQAAVEQILPSEAKLPQTRHLREYKLL
jgi:hypothetical protein